MSGTVNALLALVSLVLTALCYWMYTRSADSSTLYLIGLVLFLLATLFFGGMFLSGRVNRGDDIHITE